MARSVAEGHWVPPTRQSLFPTPLQRLPQNPLGHPTAKKCAQWPDIKIPEWPPRKPI